MRLFRKRKPPEPVHVAGTIKGEETVLHKGHEEGRGGEGNYRTSRDSTAVNAADRAPIDPAMPNIPPP